MAKKSFSIRIDEYEYKLAKKESSKAKKLNNKLEDSTRKFTEAAIREKYANNNIILDRHNPSKGD